MAGLEDFWQLVLDVWNRSLFGVGVGRVVIAIAILLLAAIFRGLFSRFVVRQLTRLTGRTATHFDDQIIAALEAPLRFVPILIGFFFATQALGATDSFAAFLANLNRSLVIFTLFWALYRVVTPAAWLLNRADRLLNASVLMWIANVGKAIFAIVGAAAVLEVWGIEVGPLIAGLGLFGVAVALGAQDLFKNLIAGVFILLEKRYDIGDWIAVDDVVEGTVEEIGFRTTKVRRFDKAPVYVPNSALSDTAMTNFSQMSHRRIKWMITLEYRANVEQLRKIRDEIEAHLLASDAFAKPPTVPLFVRINALNDSSIDLLLYCFTITTDWGKWLELKEDLACTIKTIVEQNGAGFAFPSRSIYVESTVSVAPEEARAQSAR